MPKNGGIAFRILVLKSKDLIFHSSAKASTKQYRGNQKWVCINGQENNGLWKQCGQFPFLRRMVDIATAITSEASKV